MVLTMWNRFCLTTRCNGTSEAVNSNLVNTLVTKLDTTWFRHFQFYMKLSRYVHEGKAHAWMVRTSKSCASWKDSPGRLTNMVALSWLGGSQQTKSEMFSDNATFGFFFFLGGGLFCFQRPGILKWVSQKEDHFIQSSGSLRSATCFSFGQYLHLNLSFQFHRECFQVYLVSPSLLQPFHSC